MNIRIQKGFITTNSNSHDTQFRRSTNRHVYTAVCTCRSIQHTSTYVQHMEMMYEFKNKSIEIVIYMYM